MIKITFVYPDYESLGVEYLMAVCRQAGYETALVFYFSGKSFYDFSKTQDAPYKALARKIADTKPHIVAFSCVTDNYQIQLGCASAVKGLIPDVVTIFGGFHPTAVPETVLEEKAVDCVAIGEAEESFVAFLKQCRIGNKLTLPGQKIDGIVFKSGPHLIGDFKEGKLPDLNNLPFPHKKPFLTSFVFPATGYAIMTSRGCPYSCSYCFNSQMLSMRGGCVVRQRKPDHVISEILEAKKNFSPKYICFLDDCFTLNKDWLLEFSRLYEAEVRLPFSCVTIPRYLNQIKIDALRRAGCCSVQVGVQSLNEELCRDVLLRQSDNTKIAEAITMLRNAGIFVSVDHMMGIPGDTLQNQEDSVLFYNRYRPSSIYLFYLSYFPKTKITEMALKNGLLSGQDIDRIHHGAMSCQSRLNQDMQDLRSYQGIDLLLRFLPFLPRCLVRSIISRKFYRESVFANRLTFSIGTALSRVLRMLFHRKDITLKQFSRLLVSKCCSRKKILCGD
jgi:radical SAM superfamily enzyme YgiQ (UPF0313 family)